MRPPRASWKAFSLLALSTLPARVLGGDVISTDGFTLCSENPTITVNEMNVQYDQSTQQVTFDVAGSSSARQNVTVKVSVTAYGQSVYSKSFDPCSTDYYVQQLCPGKWALYSRTWPSCPATDLVQTVPAGTFAASGQQVVPDKFAKMIPSIAFTIPDLDGAATLQLVPADDPSADLACIKASVSNGKSMNVAAVQYAAAGMAGSALVISGVGGALGGFHAGGSAPSPSFSEVFGWFQGMAVNGMLSVSYPSIYQSFSKNFAFSTGIIPWGSMQRSIDGFRQSTGGNLTADSWEYLQNATLVYSSSSNGVTNGTTSSKHRRSFEQLTRNTRLYGRDNVQASVNGTTAADNGVMHYVHGMQAYVEQLSVPQANTFMTILLVVAIVIAAITVGILLTKVILEAFALGNNLPKCLESFRKRYWWRLAKTITNLILLLYGVWTLWCVYQFTDGDSWAAKVLAGVTWAIFTGILTFFTVKIILIVRKLKSMEGDNSALYEDKETWVKYSLFYDNFKKGYWWLFIPSIIYMFAKNAVVAGANGHGLAQTIGQGIVECAMLAILVWSRPYSRKSGNVINIVIQTVRVLSVICVFIFVEELGISQTTKTVTGVVLIVVQGVLTGVLAILIAVNAVISCVKMNPHRQRRKAAEEAGKKMKLI